MLEQSSGIAYREGVLTVEYRSGQESVARPLQRKESLEVIRRHAERAVGRKVDVRVAIEGPPAAPGGRRSGASGPTPPPKHRAPQAGGPGQLLEKAKQEPGVNKLLREFGAQVVEIRPLSETRDLAPGLDD